MKIAETLLDQKRRRNLRIAVFVILLIIVIFSELIYREPLFLVSLDMIKAIFSKSRESKAIRIITVMSDIVTSEITILLTIATVYTFANVYKSTFLLLLLAYSSMLGAILNTAYSIPLMYYSRHFKDLKISINSSHCVGGWGNPSILCMMITTSTLSLCNIMLNNSHLRGKRLIRAILNILAFLVISVVNLSNLLLFIHSINQILFGTLMGFIVYSFGFHVLEANLNSGKEFTNLTKTNFIYLAIKDLVILSTMIGLHLYSTYSHMEVIEIYNNNIDESPCGELVPEESRFSMANFFFFFLFSAKWGILLGIRSEQFLRFNGDLNLWKMYNFERNSVDDQDSLYSNVIADGQTQWNHTSGLKSLCRFGLVCVFTSLALIPSMTISENNSLLVRGFFKGLLPWLIFLYCLFFPLKTLFRYLGLTNEGILEFKDRLNSIDSNGN